MAFTVQDDGGAVANANSYATVDEFKDYHKDRGNDYTSYGGGDIQKALVVATDYLDVRFSFVGHRLNTAQTTEWPRRGAYDSSEYLRSGIPIEVKEACIEYAFIKLGLTTDLNPTPDRDDTGRVVQEKKEKVGPIEESVTYTTGGIFKLPKYPVADRKLIAAGLTTGGTVDIVRS